MAVEVNVERQAVELTYDKSLVQGDEINVRAENPDGGDVSTRDGLANDGRFTWTYPVGYSGIALFTVAGVDGGSDTGEVQLGSPVS